MPDGTDHMTPNITRETIREALIRSINGQKATPDGWSTTLADIRNLPEVGA